MPTRKSAFVALVLLVAFILLLPMLEYIDSNDLVLTGQDLEISVLDLLTIFCIWFILVARLFAFLPRSWSSVALPAKAPPDRRALLCNQWIGMLFLPDELLAVHNSRPLLI